METGEAFALGDVVKLPEFICAYEGDYGVVVGIKCKPHHVKLAMVDENFCVVDEVLWDTRNLERVSSVCRLKKHVIIKGLPTKAFNGRSGTVIGHPVPMVRKSSGKRSSLQPRKKAMGVLVRLDVPVEGSSDVVFEMDCISGVRGDLELENQHDDLELENQQPLSFHMQSNVVRQTVYPEVNPREVIASFKQEDGAVSMRRPSRHSNTRGCGTGVERCAKRPVRPPRAPLPTIASKEEGSVVEVSLPTAFADEVPSLIAFADEAVPCTIGAGVARGTESNPSPCGVGSLGKTARAPTLACARCVDDGGGGAGRADGEAQATCIRTSIVAAPTPLRTPPTPRAPLVGPPLPLGIPRPGSGNFDIESLECESSEAASSSPPLCIPSRASARNVSITRESHGPSEAHGIAQHATNPVVGSGSSVSAEWRKCAQTPWMETPSSVLGQVINERSARNARTMASLTRTNYLNLVMEHNRAISVGSDTPRECCGVCVFQPSCGCHVQ